MFSLMIIDTSTSSFFVLLLTKSFRKKTAKAKRNVSRFRGKKTKNFFVSGVLSYNTSARVIEFRSPVVIINFKNGQKE